MRCFWHEEKMRRCFETIKTAIVKIYEIINAQKKKKQQPIGSSFTTPSFCQHSSITLTEVLTVYNPPIDNTTIRRSADTSFNDEILPFLPTIVLFRRRHC